MRRKGTNRRAVETVLVAKSVAAVAPTTLLYNSASNTINLLNGQIGIYDAKTNMHVNPATVSYGTSPRLFLAQGTQYSQNLAAAYSAGFSGRLFEKSEVIDGKSVYSYSTKTYGRPVNEAKSIFFDPATIVDVNTEYAIMIALKGYAQDEWNSNHGVKTIIGRTVTNALAGLSATQKISFIVKKIAEDINNRSRVITSNGRNGNIHVVAVAINSAGGTGATLTSLTAAAGGAPFQVDNRNTLLTDIETKTGGNNSQLAQTFTNVIANTVLTGTSTVTNLNSANNIAAGQADTIVLIALDRDFYFEDRVKQTKTQLEVAANIGLIDKGLLIENGSISSEGTGTSRWFEVFYNSTYGQRKFEQYRGFDEMRVVLPNYIVEGETYMSFIIEHGNVYEYSIGGLSFSPLKTMVIAVAGSALAASLLTALNNWVTSLPVAPERNQS